MTIEFLDPSHESDTRNFVPAKRLASLPGATTGPKGFGAWLSSITARPTSAWAESPASATESLAIAGVLKVSPAGPTT